LFFIFSSGKKPINHMFCSDKEIKCSILIYWIALHQLKIMFKFSKKVNWSIEIEYTSHILIFLSDYLRASRFKIIDFLQ